MCIKRQFFLQSKVTTIGKRKGLSKDLRYKIVGLYKTGMGYKTFSKKIGEKETTVRQIICKWKKCKVTMNLSWS